MTPKRKAKREGPLRVPLPFDEAIRKALTIKPDDQKAAPRKRTPKKR